ncbi:MAG TPA: sensor histidine kinase [Chloroflexota bacterium]|nr:sensor histidine kinase [Chloroflexota bacterium]
MTARARRWSLARQYVLASLVVVLGSVIVTGAWIGHQIETSVVDRTAGVSALYVDSFLSSSLQDLATDDRWLTSADTAALDHLVANTGLGQGVVLFKIWSLDGRVLYSPDRSLVGQTFPIDADLARAAGGEVAADISTLSEPENINERGRWNRLVQVYAPVRQTTDGRIIAVNEFYLLPDALDAEIHDAQLRSWAVVAGIGLITYLLLASIVKRGSDTIRRQQAELQQRLDQNLRLHERVRQAAGRTTALNEQSLRRISADLHDGPGQALALALLRLDTLRTPYVNGETESQAGSDFATVHAAVRDALSEVRAISAGLRLPELDSLSVAAVATRAIEDHQRRSGTPVARELRDLPDQAPLPIKIALLRTLQEALSNATRHGRGAEVKVDLSRDADTLRLTVSDRGPGFDSTSTSPTNRLGLAGMRERAELLSGTFDVESASGQGTTLRVCWPLAVPAQA